ncbi:reverse transcriptase domain-containing protein [uncultured Sphaerochaeta sp.]|uniref:TOTE conflict system archaeo-eukaryotic primase domain-containing protein n=1 Tax=uncultured Sphaerochaeta sp. TaxID=886478 RepID=UPI002A0A46D2|nr:reverse transcriptase domain-containing protein [uncultured Sphaerochaeta sp.]
MDDIINKLADKLFSLFVVNSYAFAVQGPDGLYRTKYLPMTSSIIGLMLEKKKSFGCYQQNAMGKIRWICLDFDCHDKINPNISGLYNDCIKPTLSVLSDMQLQYLTEFSGRRGIHIWLIFDKIISKDAGFNLVKKIISQVDFDETKYGLDKFPACSTISGKRIGKQVKIPLSVHINGRQSFFFSDENELKVDRKVSFFRQLEILQSYGLNDSDAVLERFALNDVKVAVACTRKYKLYSRSIPNKFQEMDCAMIIKELETIPVFALIFSRFRQGISNSEDFLVVLGTFSPFVDAKEITKGIFQNLEVYDQGEFEKNYDKFYNRYHPATISYLNSKYGVSKNSADERTGYSILCKKLGFTDEEIKTDQNCFSKLQNSVLDTFSKEQTYFRYNDEVLSINILNSIDNPNKYEQTEYDRELTQIKSGFFQYKDIEQNFIVYHREESEKERLMVSLSVHDRVVTTNLALQLSYKLNMSNQKKYSYSYIPVYFNSGDVFYNWFYQWSLYLDRIKTYIEIPVFNSYGICILDLSHFYDSVNLGSIISVVEKRLKDYKEEKNIFKYLCDYNDKLMRKISQGVTNLGVPQGPAYARILAEIYLDEIITSFFKDNPKFADFDLIRYVDDFFIAGPSLRIDDFSISLKNYLLRYGLKVNEKKSLLFHSIEAMNQEDKDRVLRKNTFNYCFKINSNIMLTDVKIKENMKLLLEQYSDIDAVPSIFNSYTHEAYRKAYFISNKKAVMSSSVGRGSIFIKFYEYFFDNFKNLSSICPDIDFSVIPINSLNFKNFLAILYQAIKKEKILIPEYDAYFSKYIDFLSCQLLEDEEKETIKAFYLWRNDNE